MFSFVGIREALGLLVNRERPQATARTTTHNNDVTTRKCLSPERSAPG
ncbi:hypothetical protein I546_3410 [Mycobacterium kansasii 732]|nr:hypothetical protein I546_3414 [Mycobacterium kansasii 732]EUA10876.1 hypothetical protein I546_3410 [Mycobacterium kansasii 732]